MVAANENRPVVKSSSAGSRACQKSRKGIQSRTPLAYDSPDTRAAAEVLGLPAQKALGPCGREAGRVVLGACEEEALGPVVSGASVEGLRASGLEVLGDVSLGDGRKSLVRVTDDFGARIAVREGERMILANLIDDVLADLAARAANDA